jgi:asparagine synthase (glutamine-hydrolysing)
MASMALKHRGPDGHGELELQVGRTKMVLGHRRLAIIDLSEAGRQPMESTCGRWAIVFNGEIYNYRELRADLQRAGIAFRSDSDTEVLLACWAHWGEACLPRLVGMFAFAIVDRAERSLTLVRDAFGIKPLFYACDGGRLSFASELVAMATLHGLAPDVDVRTAHRFLRWGECDLGFSTFIRGASQLPPAMLAQFRLEDRELRPSLRRWWNPCLDEDDSVTFADAAERFRALFLESVRLHLRSDVPVGISLSGGIDSASIACVVRMLEPEADIHTFTYVADSRGGAVNEEGPADLVNRQIRAHSHKIHISTSDLDRDLEDLVRAQGEPFVSGTMYAQYCVFREARRSGIIVMLEGQGADELLGGYVGYPAARFRSYVDRLQLIDAVRFGHGARHWPGCQRFRPWRSLLREAAPDFIDRMFLRLSGRGRSPGWISEDAMSEFALVPWHQPIPPWKRQSGRRLAETLLAELTCTGVPRLMRDGDRNAMRFSVENRVPFLSLPLAESVLRSRTGERPSGYFVLRCAESSRTRSLISATRWRTGRRRETGCEGGCCRTSSRAGIRSPRAAS